MANTADACVNRLKVIVYINMTEINFEVQVAPTLHEELLSIESGKPIQLVGGVAIERANIRVSTEAIAEDDKSLEVPDASQSLRIYSEVSSPVGQGHTAIIAKRFTEIILNREDKDIFADHETEFNTIHLRDYSEYELSGVVSISHPDESNKEKRPSTIVIPSMSGKNWNLNTSLGRFKPGEEALVDTVEETLMQHKVALEGLVTVLLNANMSKHSKTLHSVSWGVPQTEKRESLVVAESTAKDGFEAFAGIDGVIKELRGMVELARMDPDILQNAGVELTQAALFYGPSGTGKTELMRTLSAEIGLNERVVNYSDLSNMYVGEWAKNLDAIFEDAFASEEDVAIVFDEFDGLTVTGNPGVNNSINSVLKTRLEQLPQHPNVFVFMATNDIDYIDPVVRADKRIPLKIPIPIPSQEERRDIFKKLLVDNRISSVDEDDFDSAVEIFVSQDGFDFERLAFITDQFTGGDISQILKEVNKARLIESLKNNGEMPPLTMELLESAIDRAKKTRS